MLTCRPSDVGPATSSQLAQQVLEALLTIESQVREHMRMQQKAAGASGCSKAWNRGLFSDSPEPRLRAKKVETLLMTLEAASNNLEIVGGSHWYRSGVQATLCCTERCYHSFRSSCART